MSKTALLGLTKVLAEECAPDGIRVNCIAPGFIKTPFSSAVSTLVSFLFPSFPFVVAVIALCSSHENLLEVSWTVTVDCCYK